jgi:hypothetical protein
MCIGSPNLRPVELGRCEQVQVRRCQSLGSLGLETLCNKATSRATPSVSLASLSREGWYDTDAELVQLRLLSRLPTPCFSRGAAHIVAMSRRKRRPAFLPIMIAELMRSSWETVARRTWIMAQGSYSAAEYRHILNEKVLAAYSSGLMLANNGSNEAMLAALAPWHRRATANAERLRKT